METLCDLTKPWIMPYNNTWKRIRNTVFWCNLELAQERGLQFYQTRSHAVVLCNTLLAGCIEKAVCMQTTDELYLKVRFTPRVPRVVLKSNSRYDRQDLQNQDARSSWEPSSDSKSYGETCNEQQDTTRENKVKKLIEKFENYITKGIIPSASDSDADDQQVQQKMQDLIADLNNTEIFELCEISSKQQCHDCDAFWDTGIIYCSCGRNMKSTRSPTEFNQNNRDVTSIPGNVIKKNSSRGSKHGPFERPRMNYRAKQMLEKARQQKHGRHPTILSRWYASQSYRDSLCAIGWSEHHKMSYDRIAVEKHIYVATKSERIQNSKHWILTVTAEGPNNHSTKMPTIARRSPGKDPRRIWNHSSQSTNKTAKRTTFRGQRRI